MLSYTVEVRTGALDEEPSPAQMGRMLDALTKDRTIAGPVIAVDGSVNALEIRACADAARTLDAIAAVVKAIDRALRAARISATQGRVDAWPDMIGVEHPDEIVNGGEVAARLKLSRQRILQLHQAGRFPRPVAETERDRIWRWGDVAEWAIVTERKAKPRRKHAAA